MAAPDAEGLIEEAERAQFGQAHQERLILDSTLIIIEPVHSFEGGAADHETYGDDIAGRQSDEWASGQDRGTVR